MKNYEEKEKKLDNVLKRLNSMSSKVVKMNNDINLLNLEKNQLLREKEESERNFQQLSKHHEELKSELEKINTDVEHKFDNQNNFSKKRRIINPITIMQAKNFPAIISLRWIGEDKRRANVFDFFSSAKLRMVTNGIISRRITAMFWKDGSITISFRFNPIPPLRNCCA